MSKPPSSGIFNLLITFSFLQIKKINTYNQLFLKYEKINLVKNFQNWNTKEFKLNKVFEIIITTFLVISKSTNDGFHGTLNQGSLPTCNEY
jgi:hypothetical protein